MSQTPATEPVFATGGGSNVVYDSFLWPSNCSFIVLEYTDTFQQGIKNNPQEASFYVLLGQLLQSRRDWNGATEAYQKALAIKPENPLASNGLASVMLQSDGNLDVALSLAQTARRGLPDSPIVADTLGWIYYRKGAYHSAVDLLREALKLGEETNSPDNPRFHYHLGMAYAKGGQATLARQQLQQALKLNPNSSDAEDAACGVEA